MSGNSLFDDESWKNFQMSGYCLNCRQYILSSVNTPHVCVTGPYKAIRPTHQDTFLYMANTISKLSYDAQTKCGCVITDMENRVLGVGYNSPPRKCDNSRIPNVRPDKAAWYIHSEHNCVLNCQLPIKDGIAYINARPCFRCLSQVLWQGGVTKVVYYDGSFPKCITEEDYRLTEEFLGHVPMEIVKATPDFSLLT